MHAIRQSFKTPRRQAARSGWLLIEPLVASVVLAAVLTAAASTLLWIKQQRQIAAQQQIGLAEVANQMERLTLLPFDELTPERAADAAVTEETARMLRDARLDVSIVEDSAAPPSKRISLRLTWTGPSGRPAAPCRLTAWVVRREEQP